MKTGPSIQWNIAVFKHKWACPNWTQDKYLPLNLKKSLTWQVKRRTGWSQTQQPEHSWQRTIVSSVGEAAELEEHKPAQQSHIVVLSALILANFFVDFQYMKLSLMLLLLGKKVVLSGDGEKLDSMLSARSSKLQRASLFPIRGLSLSSRHWQHREKEEKQSIWDPFTFIILPGDFGDLPSFPLQAHAHTDTEAHISKCILLTWLRADGQHELIERNKVAEIKQTHSKMSVHVQTRTCTDANAHQRCFDSSKNCNS